MLAKELISDDISPLMTSDSGLSALRMMEEYKVRHLPVVNGENLLGVISEDDIFNMEDPEGPIAALMLNLQKPYIFDYQHIYDVFKEISEHRLSLIPVLNTSFVYLGVINVFSLLHAMSKFTAINQPGGIIVLSVSAHDYSLAQIAQIIESNDAKVLSSYIYSRPESSMLEVSIKVNKIDLSAIIQTFERYNYTITTTIFENESEDIDERYESFMKYLNI